MILAMDSSGSMTATDVAARPDDGRPRGGELVRRRAARTDFKVGVVSFSDKADVVVPPTADRDEARRRARAARGRERHRARRRDRALGRPRAHEPRRAAGRETRQREPLVVLVLSDGASTTGDYEPLEAAQQAVDAGVPVYTVALGTDEGTIEGPDGYGGTRTIRVPPDRRR